MNALTERLVGAAPGCESRALADLAADGQLAIAIDTMVEGVHFDRRTGPRDLGYKALACNLSDLAAMGARPLAASLSLSASREQLEGPWINALASGLLSLADAHRMTWRGAVTRCGPVVATVEVIGALEDHPGLRRAGARPGDILYVTGTLGDAGAALTADLDRLEPGSRGYLEGRLKRPVPRVALGRAVAKLAHAAIDISDGLASDLVHILRASGVNAIVHTGSVPLSAALVECVGVSTATALALAHGDDYELALAVPAAHEEALHAHAARVGCRITRVGVFTAPAPGGPHPCAQWLDPQGRAWQPPHGYSHFA